jgi:hypothetical protein
MFSTATGIVLTGGNLKYRSTRLFCGAGPVKKIRRFSMNNGYLSQYGVYTVVTAISLDAGEDTVLVQFAFGEMELGCAPTDPCTGDNLDFVFIIYGNGHSSK